MVWVRYYIYKAFNALTANLFTTPTVQLKSSLFTFALLPVMASSKSLDHTHIQATSHDWNMQPKKKKPFFSFFLWFLNSLSFGSYSKKVDEPRFDKVRTPNSVFLTHRWRSLASQNNVIPWCCVIVLNLAMRVVVIVIAPLLHIDPGIWWTIMCIATLILVIRACFVAAVGWYNFHFVACFWAYVNKISLLETYK